MRHRRDQTADILNTLFLVIQIRVRQPAVTVHTRGRNKDMQTRIKLKIIVFNEDIRARQGKADSQKHQGVTSRPDEIKLNKQDYKYTGKS